jgi:DNA-binding MarR family transcriptional regulator
MEAAVSDDDLAELAEVVLRVAREIDPHGPRALDIVPLTGTEALVMRWIDRNPGVSPSAVADATALKRSNLSVAVGALVAKGMVERRPAPQDARTVQLFPTDLAARNVARLRAHWAGLLRGALGGGEPGDRDLRDQVHEAAALLTRLDDGIRQGGR